MTTNTQEVITLVQKAAKVLDSGDAMRFSQAACNAANALAVVRNLRNLDKSDDSF